MSRQSQKGFTLIELMIALVIISILAAVGIPAYNDHVKRGQRNEALSVLNLMATEMEAYAARKGNYNGANPTDLYNPVGKHAVTDVYDFGRLDAAGNSNSYVLKATPKAGGPLADDGLTVVYSDGRQGWDCDNSGANCKAIDF